MQIVDINETTFNAIYDQSEQKVFIRVTDPEILSLFPNVPATDTSGTDSPSSNMKIDAVLEEEFIATLTEKYPDSTNSIKLEELSGEDYTYYQINSQFGRIYYVVDNKTNIVSSCSALIGSSNFSLDEISTWKKDIVRSFSAIEVPDLKGSEHLGKQPYNYDEKSELFFEITLNPILRALNEMGISSNTEVENDLYLFSLNHGDNSYAFALSSYLEESAKDTITANPIEDSSEAYASVLANMP